MNEGADFPLRRFSAADFDSVCFFAIRPFAPAVAITMAIVSNASRHIVGVVASPP
jgi:hypothetical protein